MGILIIYDTTGKILLQGGNYEPVGVNFMRVTIPNGKRLVAIDVSDPENHQPILTDIPKPYANQLEDRIVLVEGVLNEMLLGGGL